MLDTPAAWGLAGAFIWSAPLCWGSVYSMTNGKRAKALLEFAIRLVTGAIAAAAFTYAINDWLHIMRVEPTAALIGLASNSAAPKVAQALAAVVVSWAASKGPGKL